jgi:hypothetical protein
VFHTEFVVLSTYNILHASFNGSLTVVIKLIAKYKFDSAATFFSYVGEWPVEIERGMISFVSSFFTPFHLFLYPFLIKKYRNPSVYEQSVYEFSLVRDSQINTFFFNLRANFRVYELLPLANRSLFPAQTLEKLIFVLRVFALREILVYLKRKPK